MKNIKPRDIVEFLLFGIGFVLIIWIAGYLETAPLSSILWLAAALAMALWIIWFLLVVKDRNAEARKATLWMSVNGQWVAQDGSGRTQPIRSRADRPGFVDYTKSRVGTEIFDQDEDAIKHLDYDQHKEQSA